jgi:uncharacterized membrane protein YdjX (TVP38/TMEM64 family)
MPGMKFRMRLLWIFITFALLVLGTWAIWGGNFDARFGFDTTTAWLTAHPAWGGMAGAGLLVADLLLPVPGTVVMSALGFAYGTLTGGLFAIAGSMGAGIAGYGIGRLLPERMARRLLGELDYEKGRLLFTRGGGWALAISRALPVLPEALSCTAGLVRMPLGRFVSAIACGSIPTGFVFAAIGAAGRQTPGWALAACVIGPALLWWIARHWLNRSSDGPPI